MNDSVSTIIRQIDETIRDAQPSRDAKIERLKNPAAACWNAAIPEYGTERFKRLESDEMRKRWATVRSVQSQCVPREKLPDYTRIELAHLRWEFLLD